MLAEIVKNLPIKLQNLELDLSENRLGENVENFKLLGNVLKEHSNGLRCLGLDLGWNSMGKNDIKYLGEGMKKLPS